MPGIEIRVDPAQLQRLANVLGAVGKNAPVAIARAINHTGDKARTQMTRLLTAQTGLKRQVIVKALKVTRASQKGSLSYVIASRGGNIRLENFGARETAAGVSAAPWGARRVYGGTFMKGGRFPRRVTAPGLHGGVYQRTGSSRFPIEVVRSGVFIPLEMVSGATAEAFTTVVARDLPDRLTHELLRVLGG